MYIYYCTVNDIQWCISMFIEALIVTVEIRTGECIVNGVLQRDERNTGLL